MPDAARTLKFAIPKGSLQEPTLELLSKAGYEVYVSSRGYRPASNDAELDLYLIRAQEIGRYIGQGFIDCGITGLDWAYENDVELVDLAELPYSRATTRPTRWVLVVPEDSPIRKPEDLRGKRIATEGVGITRRYLKERGIEAEVEFSWGRPRSKCPTSSTRSSMSPRPDRRSRRTDCGSSTRCSPRFPIFMPAPVPRPIRGSARKWSGFPCCSRRPWGPAAKWA